MTSRLRVHLGREGPKSVELEESSTEVADDFVVMVENHGPPQHVHVAPAEGLARFTSVANPNNFIGSEQTLAITVEVADDRPEKFDGQLRVVTGYGTEETLIDVGLRQPGSSQRVVVDESLGQPSDDPTPPPSIHEVLLGPGTTPVVALAAIALLVAVGAILIATELAVVLGAIAVLVGVGVAILLLVR